MSPTNPHAETLRVAQESLASAEQNVNQATEAYNNALAEVNTQQAAHDSWTPEQSDETAGEQSEESSDSNEGGEGEASDEAPATAEVSQNVATVDTVKEQVVGIVDAIADLVNQVTDEQFNVISEAAKTAGVAVGDKFDAVKYLVSTKQAS